MLFQFDVKITDIKTSMKVTSIVISSLVSFTFKKKKGTCRGNVFKYISEYNRNENLKEDILHIRSEFVDLKAFIESEFIAIKNVKENFDNGSSASQFERLVRNMEAEIVFLRDEIKIYWEILINHKIALTTTVIKLFLVQKKF